MSHSQGSRRYVSLEAAGIAPYTYACQGRQLENILRQDSIKSKSICIWGAFMFTVDPLPCPKKSVIVNWGLEALYSKGDGWFPLFMELPSLTEISAEQNHQYLNHFSEQRGGTNEAHSSTKDWDHSQVDTHTWKLSWNTGLLRRSKAKGGERRNAKENYGSTMERKRSTNVWDYFFVWNSKVRTKIFSDPHSFFIKERKYKWKWWKHNPAQTKHKRLWPFLVRNSKVRLRIF